MTNSNHVCVYTSIVGNYDRLKPQPKQTVDCDWICFTDEQLAPIGEWQVITVLFPSVPASARARAKHIKVLSHQLFPGGFFDESGARFAEARHYDYLIWIDGSVQLLRPDFVEMMISSIGKSGWALFRHPWRDCIYDEARESADMVKYQQQPIMEQAEFYRKSGFPSHYGLWCGGLIARRTDAHHLTAINELWWRETMRWTCQDQVSLPVVLWRLGLEVDTVPVPFHNDYFGLDVAHRMSEWERVIVR